MNKREALKEVEQVLIRLSKQHKSGKRKPQSYVGSESKRFSFVNLKVPHIRRAQKESYSFSSESQSTLWDVWDYVWKNTRYFEAALSAAHYTNSRPVEELYQNKKILLGWQSVVDNWALSDELSNVYSRLLEYKRSELLPVFEKWNSSEQPWEIRQSLVGLLFYARFRKRILPAPTVLKFVKRHLMHSHYYVQKAVGWTLRECWNVYPGAVMRFLKHNAASIPPGAWTAATEKLSAEDKNRLLMRRKGL